MMIKKISLYKVTFLFFIFIINFSILNINSASACVTTTGSTDTIISSSCSGDFNSVGSGDTLTINSGVTLTGTGNDAAVDFLASAWEFTNNGTVTGTGQVVRVLQNGGPFINNGTISRTANSGYAIYILQSVDTITNTGEVSVAGGGIHLRNLQTVTNFNNLQGKSSSTPFVWNFLAPNNYNIIVNSTSDYGQFARSGTFVNTFQFGIHSTSTLSNNTVYPAVLSNISGASLAATRTGTYNTLSWTLALQSGSSTTWDLIVGTPTIPSLSSSTPADDATNVAVDSNIVLNFSSDVDIETGNITIKKTSDNSTVETIDVTSGQVTKTSSSQITINPSSNFDGNTEYYVLIDATAFDHASGGSYAGISSTTALSFTVIRSTVDPTTDKDVVGSIDAQSQLAKSYIIKPISTVSSRLSYLRKNKENTNLIKNNIKLDFGNAILTSLTNELLAKNDKSIIPDNWSSWSEGSISVSKIGDRTNSSSSETDGQALALGFDTKLNDNDLLGFAIQYGKSDTDVGSSGTNVDSENINLSVYRTRPLNDNNFIEGMFGIGLIEIDLTRISGANTLTGSRNGTQIFGSINYGKTLDKGDFNLTPIARVDLGYTELDAYSETGTNALSYAKQTIESGLASVGLQFSDMVKFNENKFKPFGSIEYGMDFSNSSDAKMSYVSDTSTIYTYTQGANSNHLITSVVGFEYITINNLNIISSYKRIQGNESEQTDILNVSINFKSKRETEYAMTIDGSEDLKAGFDISKNVNGFDLKFNANQSLSENSDRAAEISLSRQF